MNNKTKSWFFERVNKIDKHLARLTKKKRERMKINEKGDITTKTAEIQKKVGGGKYYEQSYDNKFGNLEEMETFLEINSPPRFHQEEVNNFEHKHH